MLQGEIEDLKSGEHAALRLREDSCALERDPSQCPLSAPSFPPDHGLYLDPTGRRPGQPPVPEAEGPRRGLERGSGEEHEEEQGQGDASPSNESSDEDGGPSLTLQ